MIMNCTARGPAPHATCWATQSGTPGSPDRIAENVVGNRDRSHQALQLDDLLGRKYRLHLFANVGGRPLRHFHFFLEIRIADVDLEHEAVLLGLGQRIRAFLFDGILRGQHEEGIGQRMPHAAHGNLPFLHGFEHGRLRFGRGAVDFVGQNTVGEQRPFQEAELAAAGRAVLLDDFRAGNVGRH
jgi:hypothetical protein